MTAPADEVIYAVADEEAGERLDRFLAKHHAGESRNRLKALILEGAVSTGEVALNDPAYKVRAGERIALNAPAPADPTPRAEAIPLHVVYEDDALIVVDKPAGLVVHPAPGHWTGTLVNALIAHCGEGLSGIGGERRPGIVHRLDKDTSGLMVAAKTDRAHRALAATFADHGRDGGLVREYRAFVHGVLDPAHRRIDLPIGRDPGSRVKMAVVRGRDGRHAATDARHVATLAGGAASEVACRLETGRTHQIRVHMAAIGHPLLADPVYGKGFRTRLNRFPPEAAAAVEAFPRQALHAAVLGFPHPIDGREMLFSSDLPSDLAALRVHLARP